MKIISKFSDYYDCGLAYGIDEKLCFVRVTKIVEDRKVWIHSKDIYITEKKAKGRRVTVHYKRMGFCGKIYPFVYITIEEGVKKDKVYHYKLVRELFYYDMDSFIAFKQNFLGISPTLLFRQEDFFNHDYSCDISLFQKYQVAYFLIEQYDDEDENGKAFTKDICVLLPCLKIYRFVKIKEPLEAFQEISMYLGALGLRENETIMIDDKHLAESKGYDCYSFKTSPKKRQLKQC